MAALTAGDVLVASDELDNSWGPWIGFPKETSQERAFPRDRNPDGLENTASTPPDAILDAVALLAHEIASDEGPAVTSESVLDRSITYSSPKESRLRRQINALVRRYRLTSVSLTQQSPQRIRVRNPLGPV